MIKLLNMMVLIISVMISIAFFTLMERKIISYTQNRKGPNKVPIAGILQPMADAVKLISKELNMNINSNFILYLFSPMINIIVSLIIWITFPFIFSFSFMKMSILFMIACLSVNSVSVIMMSWSSNSNYAFIGMIRSVAQLISYEVNFMLVMLSIINITEQMNLNLMCNLQKYTNIMQLLPILLMLWFVITLAETSRTPFDFSEGESELVSGFNVEYSSKSFMFLFLAEYSSILFMSFLTIQMMIYFKFFYMMVMMYLCMCYLFIWVRSTMPRFRYDKLMKFNWTQLLPVTTTIFMLTFSMKMY